MRLIDADALEERLADKNNGCAGECECCEHYLRKKWKKGWCGLIAHAPTIGGWITTWDDNRKKYVTNWLPMSEPPKEAETV